MTLVKFCGITRQEDADLACQLGVDALGFVLWPGSPRFVGPDRVASLVRSLPASVIPVGVFVRPVSEELELAADAGIRVAQIHGNEAARSPLAPSHLQQWTAVSVDADLSQLHGDQILLLDNTDPVRHGGTGKTIDWNRAATIAANRRVVLAGGLTASNVAAAIRQVRPFGVDVSSGIEQRPGIKDGQAMRAFMTAVREAEQ